MAVWPFALPEKKYAEHMVLRRQSGGTRPFARFKTSSLMSNMAVAVMRSGHETTSAAEFEDRGYLADLKNMREKYKIEQFALPPSLLGGAAPSVRII